MRLPLSHNLLTKLVACLAVLVLVACSGGDQESGDESPAETPAPTVQSMAQPDQQTQTGPIATLPTGQKSEIGTTKTPKLPNETTADETPAEETGDDGSDGEEEEPADTNAPGKPGLAKSSPVTAASSLTTMNLAANGLEMDATINLYTSSDCSGTASDTFTASSDSGAFSLSGLVEGAHTWTIDATDVAGNRSECSDAITHEVDLTPTSAPIVTVASAWSPDGTRSPSISWAPVTGATAYRIAIGRAAGANDVLDWTTAASPFQAEDLVLSACVDTYHVSVTAIDHVGHESAIGAGNITFQHDGAAPGAPTITGLLGDANEAGGETTTWTAGSDDCGVTSYEVAVSQTEDETMIVTGGNWTDIGDFLSGRIGTGLSLVSFQNYYTLVRAKDASGKVSSFVYSAAWTIPGPPYGVTNLTIGARNIHDIEIAWTKPDDNGNPITDYYVEYKKSVDADWLVFDDGVSTELTTVVNNLEDDTSYDLRVRAYNGTTGEYSNVATGETLLDIPFFEPTVFKLINIGDAAQSAVVALEDNTEVKYQGLVVATLNAGETYEFDSDKNGILEADKPIFAAGRKGNSGASANLKGNMVWGIKDWSGKEFLFTGTRDAPHIVNVYAFEDATVTIYQGATEVTSATIDVDVDPTASFSIATNGAFRMVSDGLIIAHMHSNASNRVTDPKALVPIATDIIGFPSTSAKVSSATDANNYTVYHSNGVEQTGTLTAGTDRTISPQGTSSLFQGHSTRIVANESITANSNADSNGYCSAPYIPISLMRKKYAINVGVDFVAFASLEPGTITVTQPDGTETTVDFARDPAAGEDAPYYARVGTLPAGTRFVSTVRYGAWYQPNSDVYGSDEDETLLFGYD